MPTTTKPRAIPADWTFHPNAVIKRAVAAAKEAIDDAYAGCGDPDSGRALDDLKESLERAATAVKLRARQRAGRKAQRLGETPSQTQRRLWSESSEASGSEARAAWGL